MKLLVEFESKAEMDEFFAASQQGQLGAPQAIYLSNKLGQSFQIKFTAKTDEPGAVVVELHQRGTLDDGETLTPDSALKLS